MLPSLRHELIFNQFSEPCYALYGGEWNVVILEGESLVNDWLLLSRCWPFAFCSLRLLLPASTIYGRGVSSSAALSTPLHRGRGRGWVCFLPQRYHSQPRDVKRQCHFGGKLTYRRAVYSRLNALKNNIRAVRPYPYISQSFNTCFLQVCKENSSDASKIHKGRGRRVLRG